jgi:hypothetical protein
MQDKLLLNRKETADYIGVSVDYADKHYVYERDFPVIIDERSRYYLKSQIELWIITHKIE